MLRLQQVHIALKKDGYDLVKGFDLTIGPGDKAAVIGEEGNGKSTLLRWIADPDSVENYAECEGLCHCTGTIGLLSQENGVPGDRRVSDYLQGVDLYGGLPVPLWKMHGDMALAGRVYPGGASAGFVCLS